MVLKDSLPGEDRRHRPRHAEANGGAVTHVLPVLSHADHAVGGLNQLLIANVNYNGVQMWPNALHHSIHRCRQLNSAKISHF